jgi:hypothetical protein
MKRECRKWLESVEEAATRTIEAGKDRPRYSGPPIQPARKLPTYADRPTVLHQKDRPLAQEVKPRAAPEAVSAHRQDAAGENRVRELQELKTKINKELGTLTRVSKVCDDSAQEEDGQESSDGSKND